MDRPAAARPRSKHNTDSLSWDPKKDKLNPFYAAELADDKEDFAILRGAYFPTPEEETSRRANLQQRGNGSSARPEVVRGKRKVRRRRRMYAQNMDKNRKPSIPPPRILSREQLVAIFEAFDPAKLLHVDDFLDFVKHAKLIRVIEAKYGKLAIDKVLAGFRSIVPSGDNATTGTASRTITIMRQRRAAQVIQKMWRNHLRRQALERAARARAERKPLVQINRNPRVMVSGNVVMPSAISTLGQDVLTCAEPMINLEPGTDEKFLQEVVTQKQKLHTERMRQRVRTHEAEQKSRSPQKSRHRDHRDRQRKHTRRNRKQSGGGAPIDRTDKRPTGRHTAGSAARSTARTTARRKGESEEETEEKRGSTRGGVQDAPMRSLLQEAAFLFLLALARGLHLPIYYPPLPTTTVKPENISEFAEYHKAEVEDEKNQSQEGGASAKGAKEPLDLDGGGTMGEECDGGNGDVDHSRASPAGAAGAASAAASLAVRAANDARRATSAALYAATSADAVHEALAASDRNDHERNKGEGWYKCVQIGAGGSASANSGATVVTVEQLYRSFLTFTQLSDAVRLPGDGEWDAQKGEVRTTKRKKTSFEVGIESFHYNGLPAFFQKLRTSTKEFADEHDFKGTKHEERISWKYRLPHQNTLIRLLREDLFALVMAQEDSRREQRQAIAAETMGWAQRGGEWVAKGATPKRPPSEVYAAELQKKTSMVWKKTYGPLTNQLLPPKLPDWAASDVGVDVDRDWCCASCDRQGFICPCPCCGHCATCQDGRAGHDLRKWETACRVDTARQDRRKRKGLRISIDMGVGVEKGAEEDAEAGGQACGLDGPKLVVETLAMRVEKALAKSRPTAQRRSSEDGAKTPWAALDTLSIRSRGSLAHIFEV
jgi:hypothetical protein